jgi:hypothetical protein
MQDAHITVYEFWKVLLERGSLTQSWWYETAAMPLMFLALLVYILMWVALWQESKPPVMYLWLTIAILPLLLIFPSFYVSIAPFAALQHAGFTPPASTQMFDLQTARSVGNLLNQLARFGLMGAALQLVVLVAIPVVGRRSAPEQVKQFTKTVSQSFTRAFGRGASRNERAIHSTYGYIEVLNGNHSGGKYGIHPRSVLGKSSDAAIPITDPVVSRHHARFDIHGEQVFICECDKPSTNGTFVCKNGDQSFTTVDGTGIALEVGDTISLGEPDDPNSVRLKFQKSLQEGEA